MEQNSIRALSNQSTSSTNDTLLRKQKLTPHAPPFIQVLNDATANVESQTYRAEPATLSNRKNQFIRPDLISLNPVQSSYEPEPAALERIGKSRVTPTVLSHS